MGQRACCIARRSLLFIAEVKIGSLQGVLNLFTVFLVLSEVERKGLRSLSSWRLVQLEDVYILSLNTLLDVLALIIALVALSAERNVSAPFLGRHGSFREEAELLLLKKHSVLVLGYLFLVAVKVASVDF